jgi:hypothetical protein
MRLRNALALAAGTGLLLITTAAAASAAGGDFSYRFHDSDGIRQESTLIDPPSGECITLPEVADDETSAPADEPRNRTDTAARVFTGADCDGDSFVLRPYTGRGSDRLKLRSVVFF